MTSIIKKELRTYFTTMSGYIFLTFLLLLSAVYFVIGNISAQSADFSGVLTSIAVYYLFLIPILTMRLFAEEAKLKTDQLLYTSPLSITDITIGKFIAASIVLCIGTVLTFIFPILLLLFSDINLMLIVVSYLGFILFGLSLISVGMFVSSLTENQIIAAVITFATVFLFFIMDGLAKALPADKMSSLFFITAIIGIFGFIVYDSTKNKAVAVCITLLFIAVEVVLFFIKPTLFEGTIAYVLQWFSVFNRFTNFQRGVLHVSDIIYNLTFFIAFTYLTINGIEKRRWR
ncbi:ABC transporter permease [Paenibacillus periandrae]|uniref:ABC transporter permease n=1 Tax=Paenibacillus periandrae TaxID=1761741 RepID=UPI001F094DF2|nr:ABC transporter permease [Paenibacillus periandrae]